MNYILSLAAASACLFSGLALAKDDPVSLCTDMLMQKQQQVATATKITNGQASTYCKCVVPKLENIQKTAKAPTQQEMTQLFSDCMNKAGIKQPAH